MLKQEICRVWNITLAFLYFSLSLLLVPSCSFYHLFSPSLFFSLCCTSVMYLKCCIKRIKLIESCVAHKNIMTCIHVDIERHWLMYNKASHITDSVLSAHTPVSSFSSCTNAESKCGGSVRSLKFSPGLCESAVWWECRGEVLPLHAKSLLRKTYSNAKQIRRSVKRYAALSVQSWWILNW